MTRIGRVSSGSFQITAEDASSERANAIAESFYWLGTLTLVLNLIRPFGVSVPDGLYALALVLLVAQGLAQRRPLRDWLPGHLLWLPGYLILLGGLASSINAVSVSASIRVVVIEFYVITVWISLGIAIVRRGHARAVVTALVVGAVTVSLLAIVDFVFSTEFSTSILRLGGSTRETVIYMRASGIMGHPNELAMLAAVATPLLLDRAIAEHNGAHSGLSRATELLGVVVLVAAAVFSGSATGLVGIVVSGGIVLVVRVAKMAGSSSKAVKMKSWVLPIVLTIGLVSAAYLFWDRLGIGEKLSLQNMMYRISQYSVPGRLGIMKEGLEQIAKNPFLGAGMDQTGTGGLSRAELTTSTYVHNTLVESWLAGGIVVFLGIALAYLRLLKLAAGGIRSFVAGRSADLILGLCASTIGWVLMDMAQPGLYQRYKWLVAAVLIALIGGSAQSKERGLRFDGPIG